MADSRRLSLLAALCLLLAGLSALAALPAAAEGHQISRREAPGRIIFGESEATEFQWRRRPMPRRTNAGDRRAYFGSGSLYSETLESLQARMRKIRARERLEGLDLTEPQEAAKEAMPPALVRALARTQKARAEAAAE